MTQWKNLLIDKNTVYWFKWLGKNNWEFKEKKLLLNKNEWEFRLEQLDLILSNNIFS